MKYQHAFTMIEMTIVLIIIGILTATLAPMLLRNHTSTMEERDRLALEEAKTAIINYAISFGGIPDPVAGAMPAVTAFGVNNWGAFGGTTNPFRLDVNDTLKSSCVNDANPATCPTTPGSSTGGDRVVFCQAVNAQMTTTAPSGLPQVCLDTADRTSSACAAASPAAFVLYSTGTDRRPDQENNEASTVGTMLNNRIYENDKRGINNSPGVDHYDDQVMSYPASAFARDCREKMGVAPEAMNCWTGRKSLVVSNLLAASSVWYTTTANESVPPGSTATNAGANIACTGIAPNGISAPVCQSRNGGTNMLNVYLVSSCSGPPVASAAVAALDSNSDGVANVTVTGTGTPVLTGQ